MSVVGAVTGNKDLIKIGSVMGLVGGIGGMVNGAIGGAAAGVEGLEAASTAAADAGASYEAGANVMDGLTDAAGQTMDASGTSGMDMAADAGSPVTAPSTEMGQPIVQNASATPTDATPATTDTVQAPETQGAVSPQTASNPYDTPTAGADSPGWGREARTSGYTAAPGAAPSSAGNFWNSFTDFANKNKTLFGAGLQLAGGAMKGASDRQMWDQKMALEQQRVNQTSYGNTVGTTTPRPGIIAGARG